MLVTLVTISVRGGGELTCEGGFHNAGRGDLEAAEYHPLASWREYMPIVTSLEQPD